MTKQFTIFVNGCFDLLHPGHIRLLEFAKNLGGFLVVAIDSDDRVKLLKGKHRPIQSENVRALILEEYADRVHIFSTDNELVNLIKAYKPKFMVKGDDYKNHPNILGKEYCESITFIERDEHSTTRQLESGRSRR